MRLPRDITGLGLAQDLKALGYHITRQTGSHLRLTTPQHGEHHLTIPAHDPLRIGTLSSILNEVASHFNMSKDQLISLLFGDSRS